MFDEFSILLNQLIEHPSLGFAREILNSAFFDFRTSDAIVLVTFLYFVVSRLIIPFLVVFLEKISALCSYISVRLRVKNTPEIEITTFTGFKRFDEKTGKESIWVRQSSGILAKIEIGESPCLSKVQEMAVSGSRLSPQVLPKSVITIHNQEGVKIGMGCVVKVPGKVGLVMLTALHVLKASPNKINISKGAKMCEVAIENKSIYALSKKLDMIALCLNPNIWSVLSVSAAKIGPEISGAAITLHGFNEEAAPSVSYGYMTKGLRAFQVNHTASTLPGWSGTPIFSADKVVGVHLGASPASGNNYGSSVFFRRMLYSPESSTTTGSMFSEQDIANMYDFEDEDVFVAGLEHRLRTNRNHYSHEQNSVQVGEFQGDWWMDDEFDFDAAPPIFSRELSQPTSSIKPRFVVMESSSSKGFLPGTSSTSQRRSLGVRFIERPVERTPQSEKPASHTLETSLNDPQAESQSQSLMPSSQDFRLLKEHLRWTNVIFPKLLRIENLDLSSTILKDSSPLSPLLRVLSRKELLRFQNSIPVRHFQDVFSGKERVEKKEALLSLKKFIESLVEELFLRPAPDSPIC